MLHDMAEDSRPTNSITVNRVPIDRDTDGSRFNFFGVEGIIFWKDPSLLSLLAPLREEVGEELYALLVAYEVSKGPMRTITACSAAWEPVSTKPSKTGARR